MSSLTSHVDHISQMPGNIKESDTVGIIETNLDTLCYRMTNLVELKRFKTNSYHCFLRVEGSID